MDNVKMSRETTYGSVWPEISLNVYFFRIKKKWEQIKCKIIMKRSRNASSCELRCGVFFFYLVVVGVLLNFSYFELCSMIKNSLLHDI